MSNSPARHSNVQLLLPPSDTQVIARLRDSASQLRRAIREAERAGWGSILVQLREALANIEYAVKEAS